MKRLLFTGAIAGTLLTVYLAASESAKDTPANAIAICPVRVSDECRAALGLKPYETVRFPVHKATNAKGEVEVTLPPVADKKAASRDCVEVLDWAACKYEECGAKGSTACEKWEAASATEVFISARSESAFVIPDCRGSDGGWVDNHAPVACTELDGGWRGCNVALRTQRTGAACLDAPTGVVIAGERLESSL